MNPMMQQMLNQMMGQMAQQNPMIGTLMQTVQGSHNKQDARKRLAAWIKQNPSSPHAERLAQALAQTSGMSDEDFMQTAQKLMTGVMGNKQ